MDSRNYVEYEGIANIDETIVAAAIRVTREVADRVAKLEPVRED